MFETETDHQANVQKKTFGFMCHEVSCFDFSSHLCTSLGISILLINILLNWLLES
jgi:hypothetical protein